MGKGQQRVVDSATALLDELDSRLKGAPDAYRDGDRVVPIKYSIEVQPLETRHEYDERDVIAYHALGARPTSTFAANERNTAFRRLVHAQQSDDGVGMYFMTPNERELASVEWGKRLRDLIEAGKRKRAAQEPSVLVDLQDIDE